VRKCEKLRGRRKKKRVKGNRKKEIQRQVKGEEILCFGTHG